MSISELEMDAMFRFEFQSKLGNLLKNDKDFMYLKGICQLANVELEKNSDEVTADDVDFVNTSLLERAFYLAFKEGFEASEKYFPKNSSV
ncbi:hypothetical protein ACWOFR_03595 [Carnobacterium gallinarum]|uniref:hypothetical protein n=1 Tax=Carnobacterium gallinarum TaxID=2749 RepID=UPI0005590177|nr:hypothetical protein [Carnobacterium gallinarum]